MTTKYEIKAVREQILEDLQEAYPETFEAYEASTVLGERIFGTPKPHPNAVLNLFRQCSVTFALPYAFYMACRGGLSSLTTTAAGAKLSAPVLAVTVRGLGNLRAAELKVANRIIFQPKLHRCAKFLCMAGTGLDTDSRGELVFQNIFKSIVDSSSDMATTALETPKFPASSESHFCTRCLEAWLKFHREARREVWCALPEYFGLNSTEGSV